MKKLPLNHEPSLTYDPAFEQEFFYSDKTYIHPTAQVGPNVQLGSGVKIGPYAIIIGNVFIGDNTHILAHAVIGTPAQDTSVKTPLGSVHIGSNTIIKEFVTVSAPKYPNGETRIGNNCLCMHFSHVAHDATLEDFVVMTNNAQIAGHVYIEKKALLMAHTTVHQHCRIGAYSALAPFSGIRQDIPPFCIFTKQPAVFVGLNKIKLVRENFSRQAIADITRITNMFYRKKCSLEEIEAFVQEQESFDSAASSFLSFIKKSQRGISRKTLIDGIKS